MVNTGITAQESLDDICCLILDGYKPLQWNLHHINTIHGSIAHHIVIFIVMKIVVLLFYAIVINIVLCK